MKLPCTFKEVAKKEHDLRSFGRVVLHKGLDSKSLPHFSCMKLQDEGEESAAEGQRKCFNRSESRRVDLSELFIGHRFAHGAHSQLYHGIYKDVAVAVKMIRVRDDEKGDLESKLVHQYNREVALLSHLHHPNVIELVGAIRKPPVFCIVTEYLSAGSLRAYLHTLQHRSVPLQKSIAMALDIAKGMEYVHSQGVIHKDLKPDNILINQDFRLKIADFGIACGESCCDLLCDDLGTYRWMAPEIIKRKSYDRKVDVYSFGLVLWEMMTGSIPYEGMNPMQVAFAVVNKNLRPKVLGDCPQAMKALIEQCWSLNPRKRPEFWQIVKVLEQFESSLTDCGTLNIVSITRFQNHRRGLIWRNQKV